MVYFRLCIDPMQTNPPDTAERFDGSVPSFEVCRMMPTKPPFHYRSILLILFQKLLNHVVNMDMPKIDPYTKMF